MSARKKAPKVEKLVLPDGTWSSEPVEPVVEQHVPPIVPADELKMPERLRDVLDRALAEGTVDAGDGCTAQRLEPPAEAALVSLPKSQLLYVSFGDIRPANRRLAVVLLQPAALNGWQYLKAQRLLVEASVPIFMALENLFGRGERWSIEGVLRSRGHAFEEDDRRRESRERGNGRNRQQRSDVCEQDAVHQVQRHVVAVPQDQ
jgi:hypothetical protein